MDTLEKVWHRIQSSEKSIFLKRLLTLQTAFLEPWFLPNFHLWAYCRKFCTRRNFDLQKSQKHTLLKAGFDFKFESPFLQLKVVLPSRGCRGKYGFFHPPPEASTIGRMIKPFGMRRIQISFSKPPMLDYTCGEHVVNTRWVKVKKW